MVGIWCIYGLYMFYTMPCIITRPIRTNINRNGISTSNHEMVEYPSLQIRFRTQVQNKTYRIFAINIAIVLGTLHEKQPKSYLCW